MDKAKVSASFSRAACRYDSIAHFQQWVCKRMAALLPELSSPSLFPARILDAGCGTGFGSEWLKRLWPKAVLTGCDLSLAMVDCMHQKGFSAVLGDMENLPFEPALFDFYWSSLALQWCNPVKVFSEANRVLESGGGLFFSTLAPGTLSEVDFAFSGIDAHRRVLPFYAMSDIEKVLCEAGFAGVTLSAETQVMRYSDLKSLLESIRGIGAGQSGQKRQALLGKKAWQTILARYETFRDKDGLLPVTYELVFGYALKSCNA